MNRKAFEYQVVKLGEDEVANAPLIECLAKMGAEGWEYCDDLSAGRNSILVFMREKGW